MSQMQTYLVRGMTCGHCVGAVTGELEGIDTVTAVTVDVVPEGDSGRAARRSSLGVSDGLCRSGNWKDLRT